MSILIVPICGAGGAIDPDDLTATAADVLKDKIAGVKDSDEPVVGTLEIQSILSFSAAPSSATQVTCTWQNPEKGPFSGVIIVGKTGGYPTSITDGTRLYKGYGNNSTASGTSAQVISGLVPLTTYYLRAFSYALKNSEEWISDTTYTATASTPKAVGSQIFTSSGTFTVPAGVTSIDIFCVGGGCQGVTTGQNYMNGGGGGGYTATRKGYAVTPGQTIAVTVGAQNGTTSFGSVLSARGATLPSEPTKYRGIGGSGGSGGGPGLNSSTTQIIYGNGGGSDGSDGKYSVGNYGTTGKGQGTTTRAFGESGGTLYAGGGGGASRKESGGVGAPGGAGGGGAGAYYNKDSTRSSGASGSANTGGGGGASIGTSYSAGNGGSGICIARWGY